VSEEYTIGIILWSNEDAQKGMAMDENATVYSFDARNLSEQLQETGCHEGHIVAIDVNCRNGRGLARTLHCPTIEEAAQHGAVLRQVYDRNAMEQALRKSERRSGGFYSSLR
jgi:hypothetical protein